MLRRIYSFGNYFWFSSATAFMLLMPFSIAWMLNRFSRDPGDLGAYSYAYALTSPLYAFLALHARAFIAMDRLPGFGLEDVLAQRFHMAFLISAFVGIASLLRRSDLADTLALQAMALERVSEAAVDVTAGALQRRHRPKLIAASYGAHTLIALLSFTISYASGLPLWLSLFIMAASGVLLFVTLDIQLLSRAGESISLRLSLSNVFSIRPLSLTRFLFAAALMSAIGVAETNVPRYAVEAAIGREPLGIYTTLGFLLSGLTNLLHPLFFMTFAHLGQLAPLRDRQSIARFETIVLINMAAVIIFGSALFLGCNMAGSWLLPLILGQSFAGSDRLFTIMALGAAVGLARSCLGFILTSLGIIKPQTVMSLGNAIVFIGIFSMSTGDILSTAWSWIVSSSLVVTTSLLILLRSLWIKRRGADGGLPGMGLKAFISRPPLVASHE